MRKLAVAAVPRSVAPAAPQPAAKAATTKTVAAAAVRRPTHIAPMRHVYVVAPGRVQDERRDHDPLSESLSAWRQQRRRTVKLLPAIETANPSCPNRTGFVKAVHGPVAKDCASTPAKANLKELH